MSCYCRLQPLMLTMCILDLKLLFLENLIWQQHVGPKYIGIVISFKIVIVNIYILRLKYQNMHNELMSYWMFWTAGLRSTQGWVNMQNQIPIASKRTPWTEKLVLFSLLSRFLLSFGGILHFWRNLIWYMYGTTHDLVNTWLLGFADSRGSFIASS